MNLYSICDPALVKMPRLNDFSTDIEPNIDKIFRDYILPHRSIDKLHYDRSEVELYEPRRPWTLTTFDQSARGQIERFEAAFHEIFWRSLKKEFANKKFIFLKAPVGNGKSTFVDYYFRCYCKYENRSRFRKIGVHVDIKGCTSEIEICSRFIRDCLKSIRTFFNDANLLKEYSDYQEPNTLTCYALLKDLSEISPDDTKVSICMDNVDQSPEVIQNIALNLCQSFCDNDSEIDIYKVIFPLWPDTFRRFEKFNVIRLQKSRYDEFDLEAPIFKRALSRRLKVLKSDLSLNYGTEIRQPIRRMIRTIEHSDKNFVYDICYRNLKLIMSTVGDMLCSVPLEKYRGQYRKIRDYQFIDSLLVGKNQAYNLEKNHILNPFQLLTQPESQNSMLLGPYLLEYLHEQSYGYDRVVSDFVKMGFSANEIKMALQTLKDYLIIHFDNDREATDIYVHRAVKKRYKQLLKNPAALDNFAQVTPIFLESPEGRLTVGFDDADFTHRVENTLLFLEEFQRIEMKFRSDLYKKGIPPENHPPAIRGKVYSRYFERLRVLKEYGLPDHPDVTESWWKKVLP